MSDNEHRGLIGRARYRMQMRHEFFVEAIVETRCRLIEDQQGWSTDKFLRDRESFLLASREFRYLPVHNIGEVEGGQDAVNLIGILCGRPRMCISDPGREIEGLSNRQVLE